MGEFGSNKSFIISDETVLMELRPWQREVLKFSKEIIGTVKTSLVGDRSEESTLGNFVTDAIVHYVSTKIIFREIIVERDIVARMWCGGQL